MGKWEYKFVFQPKINILLGANFSSTDFLFKFCALGKSSVANFFFFLLRRARNKQYGVTKVTGSIRIYICLAKSCVMSTHLLTPTSMQASTSTHIYYSYSNISVAMWRIRCHVQITKFNFWLWPRRSHQTRAPQTRTPFNWKIVHMCFTCIIIIIHHVWL